MQQENNVNSEGFYQMEAICGNCGYDGIVKIRKGQPATGKHLCKNCGCNEVNCTKLNTNPKQDFFLGGWKTVPVPHHIHPDDYKIVG